MVARVCATRELAESHTAAHIRTAVKEILEECDAWKAQNTYVTDNGANVKAAFKDLSWLGCAGHNLNLVLTHAFGDQEDVSAITDVITLPSVCKNIVRYAKKSRLQTKLEVSLKPAVATRWNSNLRMMESLARNLGALRQIANEDGDKKLQRFLLDVNDQLLADVIAVLQPFDAATRMLSADKSPTLHLTVPARLQLQKHLVVKATDSSIVAALKLRLASRLDIYFRIQPLHKVAAILDPRLKGSILPEACKHSAITDLKEIVSATAISEDGIPSATPSTSDDQDSARAPPSKKLKHDDFLADLLETCQHADVDEVDSYLACVQKSDDLLLYWQSKETTWPKLSASAKLILAVPATSTSSERSFSTAGRTLEKRRSQLKPSSVDGLMFLHGLQ